MAVAVLRRFEVSTASAWRAFFPLLTFFVFAVLHQMAVVLIFDVADVKKPVAADTEVDKGRLNAGLNVDDFALVDVADIIFGTASFDVKLFKNSVFNDCDSTFLRLEDVDQHFLFHGTAFVLSHERSAVKTCCCRRLLRQRDRAESMEGSMESWRLNARDDSQGEVSGGGLTEHSRTLFLKAGHCARSLLAPVS